MSVLTAESPNVANTALQGRLAALNNQRFSPELPLAGFRQRQALTREYQLRREEISYVERERAAVHAVAQGVPRQPDAFVAWFTDLEHQGPGQSDPLFPWLAEHANRAAMRWFLTQEMAGEAGFDDLVALTQLRLPPDVKLELGRNFWDEMGRGRRTAMHGPLLNHLARELQIPATGDILPEALEVGNLCSALAANRFYCYLSLGALGAIELTAPARCAQVNAGLRRLGVSGPGRRYYAVHATLDVKHATGWIDNALRPLVKAKPEVAPHIAAGALMRLHAGARCFARYREILWGKAY